ncbi:MULTISPECIES: DUF4365 domain-containing protein [unclassified Rhodococcus (in: high G+C Gram-positive bacteria)]|uniref:DUF4365 domain-containing protein n=1 Tax=unclassified Rhodococcus (in: high G+C Gram-positive bacteria) TaxID=192944 RepID=UPI00138F165B|nr:MULTISPECIES: DUF4365 domain-containing protein [unclassified Rhodococcus (in: high G+C Gram-positive bacteria)]
MTGSAGELAVAQQFVALGWGVAPNPTEHDLGTDLWVAARDSRRWDLGSLLGVQVKSGITQFYSTARNDDGAVDGWWFRESDGDHFDYWLNHQVPHIIVLHDPDTGQSTWVHVTEANVTSTGNGYKILIPRTNPLAPSTVDELVRIATAGRLAPHWEGSAWTGAHQLLHHDRLRYALLTPRLVAPHPNLHTTELTAPEAIACLIKMRRDDLTERPGRSSLVPTVDHCRTSPNWQWQLYAALHDAVITGADNAVHGVSSLIATAATGAERAAATALTAALLIEQRNPAEALDVLRRTLAYDDASPVDHAWLTMHLARCLADTGQLDEARESAVTAQALRHTHPQDPTALALAGAGTNLMFELTDWSNQNVGEAITNRDTHASWWRTQDMASGLQYTADETFTRWGVRRGADARVSGQPWNHLRAASLIAGAAADHAAWRLSFAQLAKRTATVSTDAEHLRAALEALHTAGDVDAIKLAVPHLLDVGPTSAVKDTAEALDLSVVTRTTLDAGVELLIHGADVISESTADRCIEWALDILPDPVRASGRIISNYHSVRRIRELIAAVVPAASHTTVDKVVSMIVAATEVDDQSVAHEYAKIIQSIPDDAWTPPRIAALSSRSLRSSDNFEFTEAVIEVLASRDADRRTNLLSQIAEGDLGALQAYGDVRDLPAHTVDSLASVLDERIGRQITELNQGRGTFGDGSAAGTLILLNTWHPTHAHWTEIEQLLKHYQVFTHQLKAPLQALRRHAGRVPADVIGRITPLLKTLMTEAKPEHRFFGGTDIRSDAASALGVLDPNALEDRELWALMAGDPNQRAAAALVVAQKEPGAAMHTLAVMAHDADPWVRAVVANCLARWIVAGQDNHTANLLLTRLLDPDGGTLVSRMVAVALRGTPINDATATLAHILTSSPSAAVRLDATAALQHGPDRMPGRR